MTLVVRGNRGLNPLEGGGDHLIVYFTSSFRESQPLNLNFDGTVLGYCTSQREALWGRHEEVPVVSFSIIVNVPEMTKLSVSPQRWYLVLVHPSRSTPSEGVDPEPSDCRKP